MSTSDPIIPALSSTAVAANLSCLVYLARHQTAQRGELEEASRVLLASLNGQPLTIKSEIGGLTFNGRPVPPDSPGAGQVKEHLLVHHVEEVTLAAQVSSADVIALVRVLSAFPDAFANWEDLVQALGPASERVQLTESSTDLPIINLSDVGERAMTPEESQHLLAVLHGPPMLDDPSLTTPPLAVPPPQAPKQPTGIVKAAQESERLASLLRRARSAVNAGDWSEFLDALSGLLDAEEAASSEATARVYRRELRRLVSRNEIGQLARLAALGGRRSDAIAVLRRLGADATEVLMDLLAESEAMGERRGYYSALTRMAEGTDIIIHHLNHPQWYVVRNAAELCGEMGLERALPALASQINHPDERARKSIASALVRIGTPEAMEPLGRMLKDPSPAIRLNVIGSLDGERARPLAMPLAALLQQEENPEVTREVLRALGRIGTPDALMALRGIATGAVRVLVKKARVQAVEALALAGPGAGPILQSLAKDSDREVSAAALSALPAPA